MIQRGLEVLAAMLLCLLLGGGLGFSLGWDAADARQEREVKHAAQAVQRVELGKVNQTEAVAVQGAAQDMQRQAAAKVIVKWMDRYVPTAATPSSCLSDHWLRGHDAAALGADPATLVPEPVPRDASAPSDGEVLRTIAGNYDTARYFRDRYQSCRVQLAVEMGKPADWIASNLPGPE